MTAAVIILALAAIARLLLNNVREFSRSDETVMLRMAAQTTAKNYVYRSACERWLSDPSAWVWPSALRYGNVFLIGFLFRLLGTVSHRVMSGVSTVAGIASVALTGVLAHVLAPGSETIALALAATSPLQLHLGRRALQDQLVCSLMLAGLAAALTGHAVLATLIMAALLSVKETTLTAWPAFAVAFILGGMPLMTGATILCAAPALFVLGFAVLSRSPLMFFRFFRTVTSARHDSYALFQGGTPNRLPVDLMLLAPLVLLAAARSGLTPAIAFVIAHLAVHSVVPAVRSIRMVTASDAMLRVAAAGVIATWSPIAALAFVAVNAAFEAYLFRRVFLNGAVYDPVTPNLTHALGMSPVKS